MNIATSSTKAAVKLKLLIDDRRDRMRGDAGINTLEYVVLAAIIIPAVILLGGYLINVIQTREQAIK